MSLLWELNKILFSLSKCQRSLEERNQLIKIPLSVRDLLGFWKDNSHKSRAGQNIIDSLIKSIQECTSKNVLSSGGVLSDLRVGLLVCLPILESHGEYLRSMAQRKQDKDRQISSSVDCVVQSVSEREKITIIEIGPREVTSPDVKKIIEALEDDYKPVNISTLLPVDRRRRFKVLNNLLVQQSPVRLVLWTFDNHGVAPQSVFAFLVRLEDDQNTLMRNITDMRGDLLARQKIYYPREFKMQFKFYSSSIVDVSSAPTRLLLDMMLGDSRASPSAVTKAVEERALDAILSCDEELACDLRAFNGRDTQYKDFLSVVRRTLSEFLAEDKNRWQNSYDGTIVSNMSMAASLPALFSLCVEKAREVNPEMPIPTSEMFLCRYLYPRTAAAAAACSTSETLLPLRWAVQQKVLEKPNPDAYYNMSQYKSLKTFAVSLGNDLVTMISTDDKSGIDIGEPDLPIVACQHPGKSWVPSQLKLGEGQHSFHKLNLTPSVRLVHRLPPDVEGSFYRGKPQLTVKDAVFEPSSGARHFTELNQTFQVVPTCKKPITIITNDGGPDHNIHHDRNKCALLAFFLNNPHILYLANFQMAANRSSYHPVEKLNCILNLALNGVALSRKDLADSNFEKLLKGCNSMVDIRRTAENNPGLIDQVCECLKDCKEVIEMRTKRASLKEDFFDVFNSADKKEIEQFMNILKTVDANFDVENYLNTKKKFNLTGALLEYYEEITTTSYYCLTMTRHRNMSAEFLNTVYPHLHLPFDLHPVPCPIKDPENPSKYLKFEDLYNSNTLRSYDDQQRPGKVAKPSPNIPFTKSIVRAIYCSQIVIMCAGCDKRRVVYSQHKPTFAKVKQARFLLENMRYQCGASFCCFGTEGVAAVQEASTDVIDEGMDVGEHNNNQPGELSRELLGKESVLNTFYVDESLTCDSPVEKHLYEILKPSVTSSPPCYYCGETDLLLTSSDNDEVFPLCHHCRNVKKFGPVSRRKKRTIIPREKKKKNKRKNQEVEFIDTIDGDEVDEVEDSDEDGEAGPSSRRLGDFTYDICAEELMGSDSNE